MVTKISEIPLLQKIDSKTLGDRLDTKFYNPEYFGIMKEFKNSNFEFIDLRDISKEKIHRGKLPSYKENGKIPVIKTINIRNEKIDWSNLSFTSEEYYDKNTSSRIYKNDILLASTGVGSLGKVDIFDSDKKAVVDGHITIIRCNTNIINPLFLLYYLRTKYGQIQIDHHFRGTTGQIEIYPKDIELIKILKIPMKEQERLLKFVERINNKRIEKIEERKKLLQKCQEIEKRTYQAIFKELDITIQNVKDTLFFKVDSNTLQDRLDLQYYHPKYTNLLNILEKHSNVTTLGDISEKITSGATPATNGDAYTTEKQGIPFLRIVNIRENEIDLEYKKDLLYIREDIHNTFLKRSQLRPNDVLLSMAGTIGIAVVVPNYLKEANINQALAKIVLKNGINPQYVKIFLNSDLGKDQTKRLSRPTGQANLNLKEIASLKIIIPDLNVQNKIVEKMKIRRKEIQKFKKSIEKIEKESCDFINQIEKYLEKMIANRNYSSISS